MLLIFVRRYQRQLRQQEENLLPDGEILTLSPQRIKSHHPKCPNHLQNSKQNINNPEQQRSTKVPLNAVNTVLTTKHSDQQQAQQPHSPLENVESEGSRDSIRKNGNEKNRTIRLKIPNAVETEHLIVRNFNHFSLNVYLSN